MTTQTPRTANPTRKTTEADYERQALKQALELVDFTAEPDADDVRKAVEFALEARRMYGPAFNAALDEMVASDRGAWRALLGRLDRGEELRFVPRTLLGADALASVYSVAHVFALAPRIAEPHSS